jgi:hypothetical protein
MGAITSRITPASNQRAGCAATLLSDEHERCGAIGCCSRAYASDADDWPVVARASTSRVRSAARALRAIL